MSGALAGFGMAAVYLAIIVMAAISISDSQKRMARRRREMEERRVEHEKRMEEYRKRGLID